MSATDIMHEAQRGLKELEEARERILKHAAVMMLKATLPIEVKGVYKIFETTKSIELQQQKNIVKAAVSEAKESAKSGL
ncbi:MAG TPA: hypothetical protein H9869_05980 [Candidatus Ligilactobacillus excrementipullorum]|nr:hypothetical protein [Candidatus Ligilactobacillus excrementipullorum]